MKTDTSKLTVAKLQQWAEANKQLVVELLAAQIFAEVERERVNTYIRPVFDSFGFIYAGEIADKCNLSGPIESPKDLYLCQDEEKCAAYYEACDKAHREHGFTGEHGYCPALIAETKVTEAEWTLLAAGAELLGCEADDARSLCGENRKKALELFTGMGVVALGGKEVR